MDRSFIWGISRERKKWELLSWIILFYPKLVGGVGMGDPKTLVKVLGANIWWIWLTNT
jgi:hypothetical protein